MKQLSVADPVTLTLVTGAAQSVTARVLWIGIGLLAAGILGLVIRFAAGAREKA